MFGNSPLVSIILPTHNRADVLPFAIQSALYQNLSNFELLIAGDGCTDNTEDLVKSYNDPRICWLNLPKAPGVGYANRNVALRKSRGKYIAYLAHDDIWLPDHLELLINLIKKNKKEFVYSRGVNVTPDGIMHPSVFNLNNSRCLKDFLSHRKMFIPLSSVIHLKACLDKYGYWDESYLFGGDRELYIRFIKSGKLSNFVFYPVPTSLRFRALWHRGRTSWWKHPKVYLMHKLNMIKDVYPKNLHFKVRPSQTEQETLWQIINQDAEDWSHKFRDAVLQLMDSRLYDLDYFFPLLMTKAGTWLTNFISPFRKKIGDNEKIELLKKQQR